MALSFTGTVIRKVLQTPMPADSTGGNTVGVVISLSAGPELTITVPLAEQSNYEIGSTITFNQA